MYNKLVELQHTIANQKLEMEGLQRAINSHNCTLIEQTNIRLKIELEKTRLELRHLKRRLNNALCRVDERVSDV